MWTAHSTATRPCPAEAAGQADPSAIPSHRRVRESRPNPTVTPGPKAAVTLPLTPSGVSGAACAPGWSWAPPRRAGAGASSAGAGAVPRSGRSGSGCLPRAGDGRRRLVRGRCGVVPSRAPDPWPVRARVGRGSRGRCRRSLRRRGPDALVGVDCGVFCCGRCRCSAASSAAASRPSPRPSAAAASVSARCSSRCRMPQRAPRPSRPRRSRGPRRLLLRHWPLRRHRCPRVGRGRSRVSAPRRRGGRVARRRGIAGAASARPPHRGTASPRPHLRYSVACGTPAAPASPAAALASPASRRRQPRRRHRRRRRGRTCIAAGGTGIAAGRTGVTAGRTGVTSAGVTSAGVSSSSTVAAAILGVPTRSRAARPPAAYSPPRRARALRRARGRAPPALHAQGMACYAHGGPLAVDRGMMAGSPSPIECSMATSLATPPPCVGPSTARTGRPVAAVVIRAPRNGHDGNLMFLVIFQPMWIAAAAWTA